VQPHHEAAAPRPPAPAPAPGGDNALLHLNLGLRFKDLQRHHRLIASIDIR
jgi:hypothetical protein